MVGYSVVVPVGALVVDPAGVVFASVVVSCPDIGVVLSCPVIVVAEAHFPSPKAEG